MCSVNIISDSKSYSDMFFKRTSKKFLYFVMLNFCFWYYNCMTSKCPFCLLRSTRFVALSKNSLVSRVLPEGIVNTLTRFTIRSPKTMYSVSQKFVCLSTSVTSWPLSSYQFKCKNKIKPLILYVEFWDKPNQRNYCILYWKVISVMCIVLLKKVHLLLYGVSIYCAQQILVTFYIILKFALNVNLNVS